MQKKNIMSKNVATREERAAYAKIGVLAEPPRNQGVFFRSGGVFPRKGGLPVAEVERFPETISE